MKLVLFDIDGTLLKLHTPKSKEVFRKTIGSAFSRHVPESALPSFAGMTDLLIIRLIAENIGIPEDELYGKINVVEEIICEEFQKIVKPELIEILPGVKQLVSLLGNDQGFSLGLLTGNFERNAYLKVNSIGLGDFFPIGAFGSDRENRNELPAIAIRRANLHHGSELFSEENCIIIGDSERDIECGRSNNIPVVAVATGYKKREEREPLEPDVLLDDFSDVRSTLDILRRI